MFSKVLIANRGEIACRIIRTLRRLEIVSVAIYSEADADSLHVIEADEAYCVGKSTVAESYLRQDAILEIAKASGSEAVHPGYGLLSESPTFAQMGNSTVEGFLPENTPGRSEWRYFRKFFGKLLQRL